MYVSWNDFNVGGGALFVTYSTDAGATWATPVVVSNTGTFIRNVQITGDPSGNGVVYIAGMDEGGGSFPHNNINKIFKSTNGGASWTKGVSVFPDLALPPWVTLPACLPMAGALAPRGLGEPAATTTWFTWSMRSTAPAPTLACLLHPVHRRRCYLWRAVQTEQRCYHSSSVAT
jgi:hypothetical protein